MGIRQAEILIQQRHMRVGSIGIRIPHSIELETLGRLGPGLVPYHPFMSYCL
jgi:hypothetical protein